MVKQMFSDILQRFWNFGTIFFSILKWQLVNTPSFVMHASKCGSI